MLRNNYRKKISLFSTQTKSGSKTLNVKNSNEILYSIKISGNFTYTRSPSSCTTSVTDNAWEITSKSATKSRNKAIGYTTAKRYFLGLLVETRNETITLSCSPTGKLS